MSGFPKLLYIAFSRLRGSNWDRRGIRLYTKLKIYRSVVLPTLLYACETWTVYQRHAKRLNRFHTSCLRKLLKNKWQDRIQDTEFLKRARMQSVQTRLKLAQLKWTGQVTRIPDERWPKKILYGELQAGKHSRGGRKKRCKDTVKASLKDFNIPTESLELIAHDRAKWRGLIRRNAKRISEAEQKRAQRKAREKASLTELSSSDLFLSICNRRSELRLVSSTILEHTNNNTSRIWSRLVIVSNDRRPNCQAYFSSFLQYFVRVVRFPG